MKSLWILLIAGQILSAGQTNYALNNGYEELNPIYGKHPEIHQIYLVSAMTDIGLYGLTKAFPEHEKKILIGANIVTWGVFFKDNALIGGFNFRW